MATRPITVGCPKCKAKVGDPCVYFATSWRWDDYANKVIIKHKEGEPTTRFHNERFNLASKPARLRNQTPIPVISPRVVAVRELDRQEYYQMQDWLRDNWKVFM